MFKTFKEMAKAHNLTLDQQKDELIECYHNTHKSVYGIRPRFVDFDEMTIEQLVMNIEQMSRIEPDYFTDEDDQKEWNKRQLCEAVDTMLACGAPDRRTAERWAKQAL